MVLFAIIFYKPLTYNKTYEYPGWAQGVGWTLTFISLAWIPGYAIFKIFQYPGTFREVRLKQFLLSDKPYSDI